MRQFALKDLVYLSITSFFAICAFRQYHQINQTVVFDNTKVSGNDVLMRMIDPDTGILSIGSQGEVDVFFITHSDDRSKKNNSVEISNSFSLKGGNHPCCFRVNDRDGGIEVVFGFETHVVNSVGGWQGVNRRLGGAIYPGEGHVLLRSRSDSQPSSFWCVLVSRRPGSSLDSSQEIAVGLCEKDLRSHARP